MDQQHQQPLDADHGPGLGLGLLAPLTARLAEYVSNAKHNISEGVSGMTTQAWIRVVVIAGGYMLLRPYLQQLVTKGAVRKMEADDKKAREADGAGELPHPELTPNEYRGIKDKLYALENDHDGADGTGADWGQKARVRQRQMLREMLEEDERRRAAQDEDADIQEFLED
ncbi:hypothetical protein E4U42_006344 [Claviceps africana]|uniref:Uncharacterized protein n=1 Tax=Claviceps africana TaxID=83212 RepID=A0A8K0J4I8_9HYPO|nr:hypothetical protein E4U42_006344 [Claviceps africana]